jgi:hypothetical protein
MTRGARSSVDSLRNLDPIHIGLVSDEPIRLAGLSSIFDQPATGKAEPPLLPHRRHTRAIAELLAFPLLKYLVVDLHSSSGGLQILADDSPRAPFPAN